MPELPEVEMVKRGLQNHLPNRTFASVGFDWPKTFPNPPDQVQKFLIGATVSGVERRGKVLKIFLNNDYVLLGHLKMTGQFIFIDGDSRFGAGHPNDSFISDLPNRSTRITFTFTDGSTLFYNDQRKFGWVRLLPAAEADDYPLLKKMGPEPLDQETSADLLVERIQKYPGRMIKASLLDQAVIAGIGNIYADEALFKAGILPDTRVATISKPRLQKLAQSIKDVLQLSIDHGGSTDKNYRDADGNIGSFLGFAKVFRREGQDCLDCGREIHKTKVAGRGTHICKGCQKR